MMTNIVYYMANIFNITTKTGKNRGILSIYILHSLKIKPKSGYEILSEIKEKTEGSWIPSKGTIYPLLKHLEKENLIRIKSVDKRSKNIFEITPEGKKILTNIKKHSKQMEEKFIQFRNLINEVVVQKNKEMNNLLFEIGSSSYSYIKKGKKELVIKILKRCASDLKKIETEEAFTEGGKK